MTGVSTTEAAPVSDTLTVTGGWVVVMGMDSVIIGWEIEGKG